MEVIIDKLAPYIWQSMALFLVVCWLWYYILRKDKEHKEERWQLYDKLEKLIVVNSEQNWMLKWNWELMKSNIELSTENRDNLIHLQHLLKESMIRLEK